VSCSVVIPTLGGPSLKNTIIQLNCGTVVPSEILVCIPKEEAFRVENISIPNVKIIKVLCRGQVAQRVEGFRNTSCEYVMQLDDDMHVENKCIEYLLETIKSFGPNISVAPSLINISTGDSVYKKPGRNKYLQKIYYWLMNGIKGYQPGKIDKSGSSVGIDPETTGQRLIDVDWLAGGCMMHHRENLVLENYWEPEGKAYYEDVIHSHELKSKGIRLIVDSLALCSLEPFFSIRYRPGEFFSNILSDYQGRKYFMQRCSCQSIRMYFYYLASCISYIFKKIT